MTTPKYMETIGVNEDVKDPPYPGNVNDPETMFKLEGQIYGQIGDKPRSWIIIITFYFLLGGPFFLFLFFYVVFGYGSAELWIRFIFAPFFLALSIITHIPIFNAVRVKFRSNQPLHGSGPSSLLNHNPPGPPP